MKYQHEPVMIDEILNYLNPKEGENYIDCTLGGGGYTFAIADKIGESGKVIAIDADELSIRNAQKVINKQKIKNIFLAHENFKNITSIVNEIFKKQTIKFDGIVFDLGLSSAQLKDRNRGFSFQLDAPLDMSFGQTADNKESTQYIVNNYKEEELEKIFKEYGEERFSRIISRKIVEARNEKEIITTNDLVEIIKEAIPKRFQKGRIHPATRVFQALRIETNNELENLKLVLPQAINLLKIGGRLAIVSFHSLEDRIVKKYFREESKDCICPPKLPICNCKHKAKIKIITKKAIKPTEDEIEKNPRSRSAKLRVAEKIKINE